MAKSAKIRKSAKTPLKKKGFWGRTARERNRLRRKFEEVKLTDLELWRDNPRVNDDAVPKLAKLISKHGFAGVIIATPDGIIRAGNTRYKALLKLGRETVWVEWKNWPSREAADDFALADNKSNEWADWDHAKLAQMFKKRSSVDMKRLARSTGFSRQEIEWQGSPEIDVDNLPEWEEQEEAEFILRVQHVKGSQKEEVCDKVNDLLKPYGLKAKVY